MTRMLLGGGRWTWLLASGLLAMTVSRGITAGQPGEPSAAPTPTAADVLARVRPAVVVVLTDADGEEMATQGSGFIVSADGLVVTAWHVVAGATKAAIKREDGSYLPAEGLVGWDVDKDFAVLKVGGRGLPTVPLGDSDGLRQGDRVLALGSPRGLENTASEGIVSALRELPEGGKLIQTTAAVSGGSSGGPLLDMQGRVVGLVTFRLTEGEALNFALPINQVKATFTVEASQRKITPLVEIGGNYEHGLRLFAGGELEAALPRLQRAAAARPGDARPHTLLAAAYTAMGRHEEAIAECKEAIRLNYASPWTHAVLGRAYGWLEEREEAQRAYEEAARLRSRFPLEVECVAAYQDMADAYQWPLERHDDAIAEYKRGLQIDPHDSKLHNSLAFAYESAGRWKDAEGEWKEAIRLSPDEQYLYSNLGYLYADRELWPEAIAMFQEKVRLAPEDPWARDELGDIYIRAGSWEAAIAELKEAIRLMPGLPSAHSSLGVAYAELGRYSEALAECRRGVHLSNESADGHYALGFVYAKAGQWEKAITHFKEAIRLQPDTAAEARLGLGEAYLRLGRRSDAMKEYEILRELDQDLAKELLRALHP